MYVARVLAVKNAEPQQEIRDLLGSLLERGMVQGVFLPQDSETPGAFCVVNQRPEIADFDPMSPAMMTNAAHELPFALNKCKGRLAVVLHPCEIRTVIELTKRGAIDRDRLLILGMDCAFAQAGPAPTEANAKEALRREALDCASAGMPAPAAARLACRLCERPAADVGSTDVLLGWIGLNPQEMLLVISEEETDEALGLEALTQRLATEREAVDREMALWRMTDRRKKAALALLEEFGLADAHPAVAAGYLSRCTLCGECIEACTLASDDLRAAMKQGKTVFIQALLSEAQRLASCSGCGFCQVSCPVDIPLCAIAYALGHQVQSRMHYVPGRSLEDPLPWAS